MSAPGTPLGPPEIAALGLASVGSDVCIDGGAVLIGAPRIRIGSHVRIDAFAILSAGDGGIDVGDHVHVAAHSFVAGSARIVLGDFTGLSVGSTVLSANDDYTGGALTGPTVPADLRDVHAAPVVLGAHVVVGAGAVVLPGVTIGEGATIGALSLVKRDVAPWTVVAGTRGDVVGLRDRDVLRRADELRARERDGEPPEAGW